jgi:hypothetical protein
LGHELTRRNIQKKAENPSKNYPVGENHQQGIKSFGWNVLLTKTNRLNSIKISRFE